ncbi:hypothetical protein GGI07_004519 [Coemansia sp. Benny D115]|nr:hypothetical protein GGI07_004519 [Coemansia sp. Benny D115]
MESAFARLYRTSKLASFDSKIKQVYATYAEASAQGEWGLKRRIPVNIKSRLMTIGTLDTKEQITQLEDANSQYMLVRAWKENFPDSCSPAFAKDGAAYLLDADTEAAQGEPKSLVPQRNISMMTRKEWQQFLAEARARRSEWKGALAEGRFAPEETLAFMGATGMNTLQDDGVRRQPTYHDYVSMSEELTVQGRVLNRAQAGFAVAVQGIIAHLPLQPHKIEASYQVRDVKTFYVHSARFDAQGRPDVILGTRPRGARESSFSFNSGTRSAYVFDKGRASAASSHAMNSSQIKNLEKINNILKVNGSIKDDASRKSSAVKDAVDHINTEDR